MRKFILATGLAAVVGLAAAGVSRGATHGLCGAPGYTPACTKPSVAFNTPSPQCVDSGPSYALPTVTFIADAGIREIEVSVGTYVKTLTFKAPGPTQYKLAGLKLKTAGLAAGAHLVAVEVKDGKGKTTTKVLRFAICAAKPVFTG